MRLTASSALPRSGAASVPESGHAWAPLHGGVVSSGREELAFRRSITTEMVRSGRAPEWPELVAAENSAAVVVESDMRRPLIGGCDGD